MVTSPLRVSMLLSASENEMTVPFFTTSSSRHDVAINESVTPKQRAAHTFFNEIFLLILLFISSTVFLLCHRRGTFNPLRLFVVRFLQLPIGRTRNGAYYALGVFMSLLVSSTKSSTVTVNLTGVRTGVTGSGVQPPLPPAVKMKV